MEKFTFKVVANTFLIFKDFFFLQHCEACSTHRLGYETCTLAQRFQFITITQCSVAQMLYWQMNQHSFESSSLALKALRLRNRRENTIENTETNEFIQNYSVTACITMCQR